MILNQLEYFNSLSLIDIYVLGLFVLLLFLRSYYGLFLPFLVMLKSRKVKSMDQENELSLLLTFRNQEENLKEYLSQLLEHSSDHLEFVAVDDFSQDSSYQVLGILKSQYNNLKVSALSQETRHSTKIAQNIAIKAASYDWLVNIPVAIPVESLEMIKSLGQRCERQKDLVVGYSSVVQKNGFFNHLYRIESFYQHLTSACSVAGRYPFLYSEDNVAFQKDKYFSSPGYGKNIKEPYLNLELIFNSFIRTRNTNVLFSRYAVLREEKLVDRTVFSELIIKSFRVRHFLSVRKKIFLFINQFIELVFLPLSVAMLLVYMELWPVFLILLGTASLLAMLIIKMLQNHLNERKIYVSSLIYGLVMPYYKLLFWFYFNRSSRKNKWRSKT